MMRNCVICSTAKGKRVCKINDNLLICPVCCAKTRTKICNGCIYYTQAEQYTKEKTNCQRSKKIIIELNPEIEDKVDDALEMAERGKLKSGKKTINELFNKHPDYYIIQYAMGVICLFEGREDESIPYFNKAIELNPYCIEAWFNKGAVYKNKLELDESIKAFRKVVEMGDLSDYFVREANDFIIGLEKNIKEDMGLNLDDYLKGMRLYDNAFSAMRNMEWEKALTGFNKVLKLNPNHVQSYGNSGICYAQLDRKQEALSAFDKALELDPTYEPAIINRNAFLSMKEGEKFSDLPIKSVEFYRDRLQKKTSLSKLFKRPKE